jgi:adenylate cyclase
LRPHIAKIRHTLIVGGFTWEVDEYLEENAGLIVAEIELTDAAAAFPLPDWLGAEVTDDPSYSNSNLVAEPRGAR